MLSDPNRETVKDGIFNKYARRNETINSQNKVYHTCQSALRFLSHTDI